jgi:lambda family phage portal protein
MFNLKKLFNFSKAKPQEFIAPKGKYSAESIGDSYNWWWNSFFSGSKHGTYGTNSNYSGIYGIDYVTLRTRSYQQSIENMYAGQVITRLQTNVVNTGLKLDACPDRELIKLSDEEYKKWKKKTESLYAAWCEDLSVDWHRSRNMGQLEMAGYTNSIHEGDCLVILRYDRKTFLPSIELIPGRYIGSISLYAPETGNRIIHGTEFDDNNRPVAYWIWTLDPVTNAVTPKRVLRYGSRTKRLMSFMVYGQTVDLGKVRGTPLLTRILEALANINDYTAFELDAAKINSMLAMFLEKNQDRPGSVPFSGITRKNPNDVSNDACAPDAIAKTYMKSGMIINELAYGEKPVSHDTKRPNVNFGAFVDKILAAMSASLEIPPEILSLQFQSNYSASRQAVVEFQAYIAKARKQFANQFNQNIYNAWLTGMVLKGKIEAPGYIEAIMSEDIFIKNAWQKANFVGVIKQNVDMLKEVNAYKTYVEEGFMSRSTAAMLLNGLEYEAVIEQLKEENEALQEAKQPFEQGKVSTNTFIEE